MGDLTAMVGRLIPPKICELSTCRRPFTPRHDEQRFCCQLHAQKALGAARRGIVPEQLKPAISRKKAAAYARRRAELAAEFGDLTDRELEIFERGFAIGYDRGHSAGYYTAGRRKGDDA